MGSSTPFVESWFRAPRRERLCAACWLAVEFPRIMDSAGGNQLTAEPPSGGLHDPCRLRPRGKPTFSGAAPSLGLATVA